MRCLSEWLKIDGNTHVGFCSKNIMADVVLLGSSHIVKLKQYIDSDVKFKNFGIENIIVEYCGIPGGRLANPDHIERFQNFIRRFRPKYAVFQLCGNDIDTKDIVISEVRIIILRFVNILKLIARRHFVKVITSRVRIPHGFCCELLNSIF